MAVVAFSYCSEKLKWHCSHWLYAFTFGFSILASSHAATITTFSPQGEAALIRQARATFSEAMVAFGDPKLPAPFDLRCVDASPDTSHTAGTSRWVDEKTWVYDFARDLPPGARCDFAIKSGLKSIAGSAVQGKTSYSFNTGGPAIVRAYPYAGSGENWIAEDQIFALLLNGAADPVSVKKNVWCEISGIGERLPVNVITDTNRDAILKVTGLLPQRARVATLQCQRPLPAGASVKLVWGRGINAANANLSTTLERRLNYKVRPAFTASFTCERENAQANCLPIRALRVEFSSPVPRRLARQIALVVIQSEARIQATIIDEESDTGKKTKDTEESVVSAVEFKAPLPEMADISIELPKNFADDSNRPLANAALFPLKTKTGSAPPLAKFAAAPFGVLELNAEPMLPVTLRHVEPNLNVKGLNAAASQGQVRDLVLNDDAAIINWYSKIKRYHESSLLKTTVTAELGVNFPEPVKKPQARKAVRYGQEEGDADREEDRYVQSRTLSLLNRESTALTLSLPPVAANDPRPMEVIGIPLAQPGYHIVEIESQKLGASLLGKPVPMYVRSSALVTNLAVHFKHGQVNSGVWVTTLDQARPVAEAMIRISDCHGTEVWKGSTDKNGFALVNKVLPQLNYGDCTGDGEESSGRESAYFVSARKTDAQGRQDMAFVWSSWNEGIESWRFNLSSLSSSGRYYGDGAEESDPLLLHTVFDRTLLRAGQTVSMKHYVRIQKLVGLGLPDVHDARDQATALPDHVRLTHIGSGQKFEFDLNWRSNKNVRYGETVFAIPQDAKLGEYDVVLYRDGGRNYTTGTFRVEEFRLPVMMGRIVPPKTLLVQPKEVPLNLQVNYGNGGGASGLPVTVSAQLRPGGGVSTQKFPGFRFEPPEPPRDPNASSFFSEQYVDENNAQTTARNNGEQLVADKLGVTLDKNGAGLVTLNKLPGIKRAQELLVQATYADPNGEIQTLSQTLKVWPSAIVVGLRADSWVSVKQKIATQIVALDTSGKPLAGINLKLRGVLHHITSVRKRLVGGFYAYDNQNADKDLGQVCSGTSDARGLVICEVDLNEAGQVELIAEAKDSNGHLAQAAAAVWVTRQGEVWFGSDNQDRMDVIPERRDYRPGETARFQVRMPFRNATALVAIERNGIVETRSVELRGSDPTIELPIKAEWAPNVYVSVLAVRGRIVEVPWYSFFTWGWRSPVSWWHTWRSGKTDFQLPTAMVDLSKPAFKYGIAEITVGTAGHQLKVEVTPDKTIYPIRATSQVKLKVSLPNGQPVAAGTEVALAAVDEALLELKSNTSWDLLNAMIRQRSYGIETATAQMQIIGKRHYGKKAAPAGGGGGNLPTRELFDTLLLWNPRVILDAKGEATVSVPLNDSLTAFRIVAVADAVEPGNAAFFGTGSATINATQDLQILAGLPPLVREGDQYRALFTLRNTTTKAIDVSLSADINTNNASTGIKLPMQKIHIEANAAQEASWDVLVPFGVKQLTWNVVADGGSAKDRMKLDQKITEAIPITIQQATLMQLDRSVSIPVVPPVGALAEQVGTATTTLRGGIELALKSKLSDGLPGVRDYFQRYLWNCLEQKASIAIGLRDAGYWKTIMAQLPLYLDGDGLANYFPPSAGSQNTGSDTLTAYLLAASNEAAQLDPAFAIPDAARGRMEAGLVAFAEGRIKRDFWVPAFARIGNTPGDLDVRKLAAIEALSRSGKAQARMLQSIQILPNQWPTGAVIDWLLILQRASSPSFDVPERDKKMAEAEQILRARLNVQGTRLGFSTERDDSWWWLMANGDVNSTRMILATLDLPTWKEDLPRIVTGTLQRQQFGHWSTTVANVWGSLAIEKFSKKFERDPVTGSTNAGFDGTATKTLDWSKTPAGGALALGWPLSKPSPSGRGLGEGLPPLNITHDGAGKPWLTLTSRAAVPLNAPFSAGYRITKTITPVEEKEKGKVSRGDIWRIHVDIDAQSDMTWVVVNDPVPAGASILGTGLGRDAAIATSTEQTDGRVWLAYQERSFEAFRSYYRYVPKGKFSVEYTVRLNTSGRFGLPQTRVEAMYAPEMFGEFPNAAVKVQ